MFKKHLTTQDKNNPIFKKAQNNGLKVEHKIWETLKLIGQNIGSKLLDMCLGNNFLTPKAKVSRAKINNGGCIKLKGFCTAKKAMKLKRQSTKWEKIFPNHISDKGLIFKIYELITAKKKKKKQPS